MPSVTPTDGGYQQYHSALKELEEDIRQERKRMDEEKEQYEARLSQAKENEVRKIKNEAEQTVANSKDDINYALESERAYNRAEMARFKNDIYDGRGRLASSENEILKNQVNEANRANEAQRANYEKADDTKTERYEQRIAELQKEHAEDLERKITQAQESAETSFSTLSKAQKAAEADTAAKMKARWEDLIKDQMEKDRVNRQTLENFRKDITTDAKRRVENTERANESRNAVRADAQNEKLRIQQKKVQTDNDIENKVLRNQVKDLSDSTRQYLKTKGDGARDAVRQYENDWMVKNENIVKNYEAQMADMKQSSREADRNIAYRLKDAINEKDRAAADIITQQNLEHQAQETDQRTSFDQIRKQLEERNRLDRRQSSTRVDNILNSQVDKNMDALKSQSEAYNDTLMRQKFENQSQQKLLEEKNQNLRTKGALIAPAQEEFMKKQYVTEYEKVLAAERARSQDAIDSTKKSYTERMTDAVLASQDNNAKVIREREVIAQEKQSELLNHVHDTEYMRAQGLKEQEINNARQADNMQKIFSRALEQQRRELDESFNAFKNESSSRMAAMKQEFDFKDKMAQRAFGTKQNELIRDFEKKLHDQKVSYEDQMADLKSSTESRVRENERKNKNMLDEQAKSYEYRIAQMEVQHQERLRLNEQNNAEAIEKLNRSHALASTKKS